MDYRTLGDAALDAAHTGAAVHRRHLGELDESEWDEKGASDFVTRVDREAEERIIARILERYPGHEVMAEESTELGDAASVRARFDSAEWLWVLDPLDGTTNYIHGYPAYAASVAVAHRGRVVAGAVVDGTTGTAWTAWEGGGAFMDGAPIRASELERLDRALIGTGFPFKALGLMPRYLRQFDAVIRRTSGVRRGGSAALDLCHVATGWLDGFWELWLAPWDIAAGTLIIREAGGVVTSLDGEPDVRAAGPILAGGAAIHEQLDQILARADAGGTNSPEDEV
ncbi:MAG TPA: inositol monophosphatase family protein [Longimicrobiales bacterium]|nr:inositol monophosphatase family protein [Longimicrobiales bacterium]